MVNGKGVNKPSIQILGNSAIDVAGSINLVRYGRYCMLLDCGMAQGFGDAISNWKANRDQLKKLKPKEIDWVILSHTHSDHCGLIPALFAKGSHAHVYVPAGSIDILRLMWEDSVKIMKSDMEKAKRKGVKCPPFYDEDDVEIALNRCIEVDDRDIQWLLPTLSFNYINAGHVLYAKQIYIEMKCGNVTKRLGYTGDIGGKTARIFAYERDTMPFVDTLLTESTYCSPARKNSFKDRQNDIDKIKTVVDQANKILIPCFSFNRTQEILHILYSNGIMDKLPVYLDSPLAIKLCEIWPEIGGWPVQMKKVHVVKDKEDSIRLQNSNEHCIVISASGFLQGGRIVNHLKTALPDSRNHVLFVGYSGDNGLASDIRSGIKEVKIDGELIANRANITDLRSFSSHASYEELCEYLLDETRYLRLIVAHGNYEPKVKFCQMLKDKLADQGKSARVICSQQDTRVYI